MMAPVAWTVDPEGVEIAMLRQLAPIEGLRVLELGCGDGRLTFRYAHDVDSVLAVDPDEQQIANAIAGRPPELAERVTFVAQGAAEVGVPRKRFELALFSWSL